MLEIIKATEQDWGFIWPIFKQIVAKGDTYVYDPQISEENAKIVWFDPKFRTFIAKEDGVPVGACVIRPNHRDLGGHIANAAFIIDDKYRRKGYGKTLGQHAIDVAKEMGYKAMQFNYVISTNLGAISLWQILGFRIIGTVPDGHYHPQLKRYVDIHIMYRKL